MSDAFSINVFISVVRVRPNIVISRIFSAYFLRIPLISAANAEEESAFFGGSCGQNRRLPKGRKAILRAGPAAAQVARSARKSSAHAPKVTFSLMHYVYVLRSA